jgi:UDP-3-O-[3-hydroxymyristoyl] glucosamine N-acyltransferase
MSRTVTLTELAAVVGGEVRGTAEHRLTGIAPLHAATPEQLTWVTHPRFRAALAESKAGAVLVDRKLGPTPMPAVVCDGVERALALALAMFAPPTPQPPPGVDPSARVAPDAELGSDVAVGPFVVVEAGAKIGPRTVLHSGVFVGADVAIGADCILWNNVVVRERCRIGDRTVIHPSTVIGADGFGYYMHEGRHQKVPHIGIVQIGDDVEIGANVCVDRSKVGATIIGHGVKIDNLVQIAHNAEIGAHSVICAQAGIAGSARLGHYVVLGGQVGIRDNIVLNDRVMVAACSCVPQDVPAGAKISGVPAVESRQFLRTNASLHRLPEMVAEFARLLKRVEKLEAATNDQSNS